MAFSTALCVGEDPQGLQFDQKVIRSHLLSCLVDGEMNPFICKKMTRRCSYCSSVYIIYQKYQMMFELSINQSINQYIAFLLCRRSLGYTLIYIIPIGLGTIANVTVLQFCIYNLLSQVIFPSFPRSSSWSLSLVLSLVHLYLCSFY